MKKIVLKSFAISTSKQLFWSLSLLKLQAFRPANLSKREPAQVFSFEYCEILKKTYFEEHLQIAAFN